MSEISFNGKLYPPPPQGLLDAEDKETLRALNARKEIIESDLTIAVAYVADFVDAINEKDPDKLRAVLPVIVDRIDYDGEKIAAKVRLNSFVVRVDRIRPCANYLQIGLCA